MFAQFVTSLEIKKCTCSNLNEKKAFLNKYLFTSYENLHEYLILFDRRIDIYIHVYVYTFIHIYIPNV